MRNLLIINIILSAMGMMFISCSSGGTSTEEADTQVKAESAIVRVRQKAEYANGRARALLEQYSADGLLSADEYVELVDMVEGASLQAYQAMLEVVEKAESKIEVVEEISDVEASLRERFKYLEQLRTVMHSSTAEQMGAETFQRADSLRTSIKAKFEGLEDKINQKFN